MDDERTELLARIEAARVSVIGGLTSYEQGLELDQAFRAWRFDNSIPVPCSRLTTSELESIADWWEAKAEKWHHVVAQARFGR